MLRPCTASSTERESDLSDDSVFTLFGGLPYPVLTAGAELGSLGLSCSSPWHETGRSLFDCNGKEYGSDAPHFCMLFWHFLFKLT